MASPKALAIKAEQDAAAQRAAMESIAEELRRLAAEVKRLAALVEAEPARQKGRSA